MHIHAFEGGPEYTIGYLVADSESGDAVLIDCPLGIHDDLSKTVAENKYNLNAIILTHGHWDHVGETSRIAEACGADVAIHKDDEPFLLEPDSLLGPVPDGVVGRKADWFIEEGKQITCGSLAFDVLHLPGHSAGHIALHHAETKSLFSGDVLFAGSIGRTDLHGGNYDTLMESIRNILLPLPADTTVYPGHGPSTTIEREKSTNPFIIDYLSHFT